MNECFSVSQLPADAGDRQVITNKDGKIKNKT